jgi:amino acid adenylation domain-containing protein
MSSESVQLMFSRMAAEFGSQTAIDGAGRQVSYAALESESNRLANMLLAGGAGRGTMVGLFSDDAIQVTTAVLGVLKAGAVFVPLDPTFPEGRLGMMSECVEPQWYVTETRHLKKLERLRRGEAHTVCLDDSGYHENTEHPRIATDPEAPCSIYFTSGSLGKPKAILGRLKGIDHFIRWEIEAVGAGPGTRVSQLASPSFDGFLKDVFVPLCSGGVVCTPESREVVLDARRLADWIDAEMVEVLHCVPSEFRALLNEKLDSRYFESLKYVVLTGEPLYSGDVKRWIELFGERIKLLNIYGTTETTLSKLAYEVKAEDVERSSIPVGKPIKGSAVMIMDAAGKPCRPETVGEIYIRTPYRSFGYYGDDELTNTVFIQNPFSKDPNDLIHKTGDYGRMLEDGNLEHLGRRDQQVQIHGVRVELGEVENLLRAHEDVADVAVIDRDDAAGNKFLVAYVTLTNGTGSEELREYLSDRLPQTMLPSAFVKLDQLPRTLNGKVDRKALPALEQPSQLIETPLDKISSEMTSRIEPVAREGYLPTSFAQHRLWFQEKLAHGTSTFHIDLGMRLKGSMNLAALEQSFNEISRRHENLRTSFPVIQGEVVQVINAPTRLSIPTINLEHLSEAEREEMDAKIAMMALQRPFDLETGPLFRVALVRHSNHEHTLLCTLHHIISDGWSRGILTRETSSLYQAFSQGESSSLPELKVQYADYAVWQRQRLQGEAIERELEFWKEQLTGAPPLLALPTDRRRPPVQTYRGAAEPFRLSPGISQRLKALSQQRGTTMFMLLLAAFQTFLHRYTHQEDIVVGTTVANRERLEIEPLIGFFVNMLALRANLSGNPRFTDLLDQVRETTLGAYAHQGTPFEQLVQELQPKRNSGYLPLFQAMFTFQNQPTLRDLTLSGLTPSVPLKEFKTSLCDLLVDMHESNEGLRGEVQYNLDLFDRATVVQMVEHFRNLLEGIATDPETRLSELPMLSVAEVREAVASSQSQMVERPDVSIHELFEAQAAATPDAVAAVFRGEHLSYRELNRRADELAQYLRAEVVKTGDLIAICMEHSLVELIGLLGVLKAGAAYVALDPDHPPQRIGFVLNDANVTAVLTQEKFAGALAASGRPIICLDRAWSSRARLSESSEGVDVSADSLAYVIYTSGSTGEPKGVGISHRSLVNYACWARDVYLKNERLGFALYSSLAFDLTVTSIYVPLITGNTVAIFHREAKEALLEEVVADDRIGICKLTPSHLTLVLDRDNRRSGVKRFIVGGEAFGTQLAREIQESFGGELEIFNEYGPTEATVGCMIYQYDAIKDTRANVPIGKPAANVSLYLLDRWLEPVPSNVTGELFISGPGLAQGYLNRASLTAERFVPNPFSDGQQMYRTGDLCRRLPGGDLEYLGRDDEQVKFRGYRVELNEIRFAMMKHPQVSDGAVLIRQDKNGHDVMVAYYVSDQELDSAELHKFLSETLIGETVPNFSMHLSKLPLTLNGKIDVAALPSLEETKEKLHRTYAPPETPQEVRLAAIWAEVLSLERVGVYEDFFELGGHSLLAAQIIHRINQTFRIDLPMRAIFDQPTIAGLALSIEEALIEKLEAIAELA